MKAFVHDLLDRPIAFQRPFVTLAGSVNAALLLSQAIYWSKRTTLPDGWFWKSQAEWQEETGLSRHEQLTARRRLENLGLLVSTRTGRRAGSDLHYWVNIDAVYEGLIELSRGNSSTMPDDGILEISTPDVNNEQTAAKRSSGIQECDHRDCDNQAVPLTEITTEITSEMTTTTTLPGEQVSSGEITCSGKKGRETDHSQQLVFPKGIATWEKDAIAKKLLDYPELAQAILDELAGRKLIEDVRSAKAYVRGILEKVDLGKFEPELGPPIALRREKALLRAVQVQRSKKAALDSAAANAGAMSGEESIAAIKSIFRGKKNV